MVSELPIVSDSYDTVFNFRGANINKQINAMQEKIKAS